MRLLPFALALALSPAAHAGSWSDVEYGGLDLHLYVPDGGAPRGLLIALHGCYQSSDDLQARGHFEPAAEQYGLVVAVPTVPFGGVLAGCWDYYGEDHARTGRHDGPLLDMTATLSADPALAIDPARIYVSGVSSGAGEALVLGCLAPEIFAGVGAVAAPGVGTESTDFTEVSTDIETVVRICHRLAGDHAAGFATQLASIVSGDADFTVARGYADLNAEMFRRLYADGQPALTVGPVRVADLPGAAPSGLGSEWSDAQGPRVSLLHLVALGHAWPAGSGDGDDFGFVEPAGLSYPDYLAGFFARNDRRGAVLPDGGLPGEDAAPPADAAPIEDAEVPDAAPVPDADIDAAPTLDSGVVTIQDAAPQPTRDAAAPDATDVGGTNGGDCQFSAAPARPTAALLLLLPVLAARRRRR